MLVIKLPWISFGINEICIDLSWKCHELDTQEWLHWDSWIVKDRVIHFHSVIMWRSLRKSLTPKSAHIFGCYFLTVPFYRHNFAVPVGPSLPFPSPHVFAGFLILYVASIIQANEIINNFGQQVSLFPLLLPGDWWSCLYLRKHFLLVHIGGFRSLGPKAFNQLSFEPLFIALTVIQKRVLNEIIHIAPGGFGCNTLYLCVPKKFLSVQLGSEIPRQLIASFSSPFLQLSPLSMWRFKSSSCHLVPPLIHCLLCIPKISMTVFSPHNVRSPFFCASFSCFVSQNTAFHAFPRKVTRRTQAVWKLETNFFFSKWTFVLFCSLWRCVLFMAFPGL